MSPRTKLVHLREHLAALRSVGFVIHQCQRFDAHLLASTKPHSVDKCLADGV